MKKKYKKAASSFVDIFQRIKSPSYYDELCRVLGRGDPMSWTLGNGQGRVLSNAHWSVQNLIKIAEEEKWKSFNEYKSILQDLHKNYGYLINQNMDNTITLDKTSDPAAITSTRPGCIYPSAAISSRDISENICAISITFAAGMCDK